MFESTVADGALQVRRAGTRWLSTGWGGGVVRAGAAYNLTVPEGWERTDLAAYAAERRRRAGFAADGPTLLTGVDLCHARAAGAGPVEAYATVGLSNPAALPMDPGSASGDRRGDRSVSEGRDERERESRGGPAAQDGPASGGGAGTVNLIVGTTRALDDAALANLVAVAAEAKAATLLSLAGFPGTTSDAVVVGSDPAGEAATFSGSATSVGDAARACVREAVRASLRSRYPDGATPASVADADHGVVTERRAEVFRP